LAGELDDVDLGSGHFCAIAGFKLILSNGYKHAAIAVASGRAYGRRFD